MKPRIHSEVLRRILDEMDKDPWYVKFKRSAKVQIWVWVCLTRKYWDKEFEGYIWKRKI